MPSQEWTLGARMFTYREWSEMVVITFTARRGKGEGGREEGARPAAALRAVNGCGNVQQTPLAFGNVTPEVSRSLEAGKNYMYTRLFSFVLA